MSYLGYRTNPYNYPENRQVTLVVSKDVADEYEFDIFAVWADAEGNFYYARDSGCSCPTPFEDYQVEPEGSADEYDYDKPVEVIPLAQSINMSSKEDVYRAVDTWVKDRASIYDEARNARLRRSSIDIKEKVRNWTPK